MSKVITFSRQFPSYHPRKGEPTYFIEKMVGGLVASDVRGCGTELIKILRDGGLLRVSVLNELTIGTYANYKFHTFRDGHRFKAGDWFQPAVWGDNINPKSGRKGPYHSKQIKFAPPIQIKKTWDVIIEPDDEVNGIDIRINGRWICQLGSSMSHEYAKNDGLSITDFIDWFTLSPDFKKKKIFDGQIICWSDEIEYGTDNG